MKTKLDELAIFGGAPAFKQQLHVGAPNIVNRKRFINYINDIFDRGRLTNNGPLVQELESQIAEMVGVEHCIATCNATMALEITARALGLNGEVIVPSFTFIATPHSLRWQAIRPIFCDISPGTYNIDPKKIEALITPDTTAILAVHTFGHPCDIEMLCMIAKKYRLRLFFDAASAFACSYKGRMIGGFGDAEIFSFHATKFFNTGEGGAVVTNDDDLAKKIRLMRNFGFDGYDSVRQVGTNGKMDEIAAAMGLAGLDMIDDFIAVNKRNYNTYLDGLKGVRGLSIMRYNEDEKRNYHYIVLEIDEAAAGIGRDQLLNILLAENVLARRYFYPGCHKQEPYLSEYADLRLNLPETERAAGCVLSLPTGTTIRAAQIRLICQIIRLIIAHNDEARERSGDRDEKTFKLQI